MILLNQAMRLDSPSIDWAAAEMPKLWRYNLHYFDFLHNDSCAPDHAARIVDDWIDHNPIARGDGWEPYPLSLRIVNWVKFFAKHDAVPESWNRSLYAQTCLLARSLERDILANHYLKNAKALIFAGAYFGGQAAQGWLAEGFAIIERESREQILSDGGHFERSVMYHSLVTEDLLDIVQLIASNPQIAPDGMADHLQSTAHRALGFLENMRHPDGEIPLFNDAAFGVAPSPDTLLAYGERVVAYRPAAQTDLPDRIDYPETGYFGHRSGSDMLVMDCGPIGPDYQPGHGHCDMLSFELTLDGTRVVVDSGVSDYEPGPVRDYVRRTEGHNTVRVDGAEQSEVWGVFRVARRARAGGGDVRAGPENRVEISGRYDICRAVNGDRVRHERVIEYDGHGTWCIVDKLIGRRSHSVESFLHLHPDLAAVPAGAAMSIETQSGQRVATVEADPGCTVSLQKGHYCPEFGKVCINDVIVMKKAGSCPLQLSYQINKAAS